MAGKADFSEDEWKALQKGVTGSGMFVSIADRDFTDSFGEASTIAKQLAAHRESESQLVRELSETHGTGFGMTASPQEVEEGTMSALDDSGECTRREGPRRARGLPSFRPRRGKGRRGGQGRGQGGGDGGDRADRRCGRSRVGAPRGRSAVEHDAIELHRLAGSALVRRPASLPGRVADLPYER